MEGRRTREVDRPSAARFQLRRLVAPLDRRSTSGQALSEAHRSRRRDRAHGEQAVIGPAILEGPRAIVVESKRMSDITHTVEIDVPEWHGR